MLQDRPDDTRRNEVMMSQEFIMPEDRNLRLKGENKFCNICL